MMVEAQTTTQAPSPGGLADRLSNRISAWKGRQDSEHEQAVVRILIGVLAAVYLFTILFSPESDPANFIPTSITIL